MQPKRLHGGGPLLGAVLANGHHLIKDGFAGWLFCPPGVRCAGPPETEIASLNPKTSQGEMFRLTLKFFRRATLLPPGYGLRRRSSPKKEQYHDDGGTCRS